MGKQLRDAIIALLLIWLVGATILLIIAGLIDSLWLEIYAAPISFSLGVCAAVATYRRK